MRVLFVLPRMVSGGVERVTLRLIAGLSEQGHQCRLALRQVRGELLDEARSLVEVSDLASDGLQQLLPRLTHEIRAWQPTHIVSAFPDVGLLTLIARRLARSDAAIVHGVHDTHGHEVARPGLWGRLRHFLYNLIAGQVYRRADIVVAVSQGVADEVLRGYGVAPERVRRIYNPAIPDSFLVNSPAARPSGAAQPGAHIIALGRLARQKGFDVLIRAMAFVERGPAWRLDIYGEGPERASLEALIAELGLGERIRLRGYTSDPFGALSGADLFVLPSRHEGLGNVLIEALACGVQVVATDCRHGPREILLDGRLGQLVPPEQPAALAEAVSAAVQGRFRVDVEQLQRRAEQFTSAAACAGWSAALADAAAIRGSR